MRVQRCDVHKSDGAYDGNGVIEGINEGVGKQILCRKKSLLGKSFKVLISFSLNEFISLMENVFCGLACESVLNNKWKLISVSSHVCWGTAKYWDSTRTHFYVYKYG